MIITSTSDRLYVIFKGQSYERKQNGQESVLKIPIFIASFGVFNARLAFPLSVSGSDPGAGGSADWHPGRPPRRNKRDVVWMTASPVVSPFRIIAVTSPETICNTCKSKK